MSATRVGTSIDVAHLRQAVTFACLFPNRRSALPALQGVRITAADSPDGYSTVVTLDGTDLELDGSSQLICDRVEPFELVVSRAMLEQVGKGLPKHGSADVSFDSQGFGSITIAGVTLPGIASVEDYPATRNEGTFAKGTWPTRTLDAILPAILSTVSKDEARPVLTGVHVRPEYLEATDSYRLSRMGLPTSLLEGSVIVPSRLFKVLAMPMVRRHNTREIQTQVGAKGWFGVVWQTPGCTFSMHSRIIDGQFPNVDQLIPGSFGQTWIDVDTIAPAVKDAKAWMKAQGDAGTAVKVETGERSIIAGARTFALPDNAMGGDPVTVGFNPGYLHDLCSTMPGSKVWLRDGLKAAIAHNSLGVYLLMPVRP